MEILLTIVIVLLLILMAGIGTLMWVLLKKKQEPVIPTPEKVFDDFRKMYDESDPKAKDRLEQMSKCIFYSSELEDKGITNGN